MAEKKQLIGRHVATSCFALLVCSSANAFCFDRAAQQYGLPIDLLHAIAYVESGFRAQAVSKNSDGSINYGLMQIHESNLRWLGHSTTSIMESCPNVLAGAKVLSEMFRLYGPTWRAVGSYNAGTSSALNASRQEYAQKVRDALDAGAAPGRYIAISPAKKSHQTKNQLVSVTMAVFE